MTLRQRVSQASPALKFVVMVGIMSFFADFTYEGSRSIVGQYLGVLGAGALAIAGSWQVAAVLIVLERVGRAIRNPPRDAMLAHAAKEMGYGWGFGVHEALDQFGALFGPLAVALLLALSQHDYSSPSPRWRCRRWLAISGACTGSGGRRPPPTWATSGEIPTAGANWEWAGEPRRAEHLRRWCEQALPGPPAQGRCLPPPLAATRRDGQGGAVGAARRDPPGVGG